MNVRTACRGCQQLQGLQRTGGGGSEAGPGQGPLMGPGFPFL